MVFSSSAFFTFSVLLRQCTYRVFPLSREAFVCVLGFLEVIPCMFDYVWFVFISAVVGGGSSQFTVTSWRPNL